MYREIVFNTGAHETPIDIDRKRNYKVLKSNRILTIKMPFHFNRMQE